MMDRRAFLQRIASGIALGAMSPTFAAQSKPSFFPHVPDLGLSRRKMKKITGTVPRDLCGTYFLVGPAKFERGEGRHQHWFDGDGMVHAFRFDGDNVTHESRFVQTSKFTAEQAADRLLYPAFGSVPDEHRAVDNADKINVANTSVIAVGEQIWALWEGGSPHAIDAVDLRTLGLVKLGENLAGLPFSAHPCIDRQGRIWSFGNSPFSGDLILYELTARGKLQRIKVHRGLPRSMVHDFLATDRYLIIGFDPYLFGEASSGKSYVEHFKWHGDQARQYLVIDKDTLEITRRYELPAAFVFHHTNAWEDKGGTLRFAACRYDDASFVETGARDILQNATFSGHNSAQYEQIALYKDGRVLSENTGDRAEFPVHDPRFSGLQTPSFHIVAETDGNADNSALVRRNARGEIESSWHGPQHDLFGEHIVVPKNTHGSWLIGTAHDAQEGHSYLQLFDSETLSSGPTSVWQLPQAIPLPLHGTWVGA